MPEWFKKVPDVVKIVLGIVIGLIFKPLEEASVLRWQKRNARKELHKRLVSVFAIIRLTLKSAERAYEEHLPVEPQLKQIEKIELLTTQRLSKETNSCSLVAMISSSIRGQ
jgi:hypothetical protein